MSKSPYNFIFNLLALVFVLLAVLSLMSTILIFAYPEIIPAELQLRPVTEVAVSTRRPTLLPSDTPVPTIGSIHPTLPPTWTPQHTPIPSITKTPTETPTITPTYTPRPSITPTFTPSNTPSITPTPTTTASPTATGPTPTATWTQATFNYTLQNDKPTYIQNWANTAGCNWLGIAGQAFDLSSRAITGLIVHIEGGGINYDALTGSKQAYGPGGYELYLTDHVVETTNTYKVQLRDASGKALSDTYYIPTFANCTKNLIMVNFVQNH